MTLKEYIDATQVSVVSVAKILGVGRASVYRWMNRKRVPTPEQMRAIHTMTMGAVQPNDWILPEARP